VSNRRWHLNLKSVHAVVGGVSRRVRACTRCIRSGKLVKPVARPKTKTATATPKAPKTASKTA
jgi:ribosomal protein L28